MQVHYRITGRNKIDNTFLSHQEPWNSHIHCAAIIEQNLNSAITQIIKLNHSNIKTTIMIVIVGWNWLVATKHSDQGCTNLWSIICHTCIRNRNFRIAVKFCLFACLPVSHHSVCEVKLNWKLQMSLQVQFFCWLWFRLSLSLPCGMHLADCDIITNIGTPSPQQQTSISLRLLVRSQSNIPSIWPSCAFCY